MADEQTTEIATYSFSDVVEKVNEDMQDTGLGKVKGVLSLKMEQYNTLNLTKAEVKKLARQFQYIELGSSTGLIMICDRKKCLYKDRCVLYTNKKCPEGLECLHEFAVLKEAMAGYVNNFEIQPDNYAEMVMINQLVEYELLEHRCNAILSKDHSDMKMESVIGVDDEGQIITKEEISHALNIKMLMSSKKLLLLQEFTATRKEKWKKQAALKQDKTGPASVLSGIKKKILDSKQVQNQIPAEIENKPVNLLSNEPDY